MTAEPTTPPKVVTVEVWPVAADQRGIWLLSGLGPWPSPPVAQGIDNAEHIAAEIELMQHQARAETVILHSTSWRSTTVEMVCTFLAVIDCPGRPVRAHWPEALPLDPRVVEVVGSEPTHGAAEPPVVREIGVLRHAVRHLKFLIDPASIGFDATIAAALPEIWDRHMVAITPAIARMYGQLHESA